MRTKINLSPFDPVVPPLSWNCTLQNGEDLCVNEGQKLSEYRVSPTERKKKERRKVNLSMSGSVGRRPFGKVSLSILVVFNTDYDNEA